MGHGRMPAVTSCWRARPPPGREPPSVGRYGVRAAGELALAERVLREGIVTPVRSANSPTPCGLAAPHGQGDSARGTLETDPSLSQSEDLRRWLAELPPRSRGTLVSMQAFWPGRAEVGIFTPFRGKRVGPEAARVLGAVLIASTVLFLVEAFRRPGDDATSHVGRPPGPRSWGRRWRPVRTRASRSSATRWFLFNAFNAQFYLIRVSGHGRLGAVSDRLLPRPGPSAALPPMSAASMTMAFLAGQSLQIGAVIADFLPSLEPTFRKLSRDWAIVWPVHAGGRTVASPGIPSAGRADGPPQHGIWPGP
jgi:hypothetical protein